MWITCRCRRWINSDGSETYANGCVTADGSVNHKYLSSPNHKPERGRGCQPDTVRHNADKYNDQQPLTGCNQHKHQLNSLRSADVTERSKLREHGGGGGGGTEPESYFRSRQIETIACIYSQRNSQISCKCKVCRSL